MDTSSAASQAIEWSVASRALPGQDVSGDLHFVKNFPEGYLIAVVDGLGHGAEATVAAKLAVETLASSPRFEIIPLVQRCSEALVSTRGVVMTVAFVHVAEGTLTWMGVGNVEGMLLRTDAKTANQTETVLLRGGVLGYQLPMLQTSVVPVSSGDILILTTDGIRPGFNRAVTRFDSMKQVADRILDQFFKGTDDALVLAARYLGPKT